MLFKLDDTAQKEALKLAGSRIGSHLYAPDKPMKGWVTLPEIHADNWAYFAQKATAFGMTLKDNE